jgi:MFS family permease
MGGVGNRLVQLFASFVTLRVVEHEDPGILKTEKRTLHYRYFVPLYLTAVAEGVCLTITVIFIPLHVRRTFADTGLLAVASIIAIPTLAKFVASNFWGALADYTKKLKPFVLIGLAGYAGCLLALSASDSAASVVAAATISSLFFAAVSPISQSYVTLLRETEKGRAVGDLLVFQSLGWFIAGIACAYLFDPRFEVPVQSILIGSTALTVAVLVVVAFLLKPLYLRRGFREESDLKEEQGSWLERLTADLKVLYKSGPLATTFILVGLATAGAWVFFGNFSVYMTEYMKSSTEVVGWVMALSALPGMFAFRPSGRLVDAFGPVRVFLASVCAYVIIYWFISSTVNPIVVAACLCVPVYPPFNVSSIALVSELSGEHRRAGGLGILSGVFAMALALGSLLGGAIGDRAGLGALPKWTLGMEAVCLVAVVASVALLRTLSLNTGRGSGPG